MASIFGHAISAIAFASSLPKQKSESRIILFGIISSILPDIDILAFQLGIPYEHMFGHRGITHSIFFAFIWSAFLLKFHGGLKTLKSTWGIFVYYFICTCSHGVFDAMTTGGRGIAFFAPFSESRHFLPIRFIQVSPIHIDDFFGSWGIAVLKSEMYAIYIPALFFGGFMYFIKRYKY